jgi:hypothetical protein
MLIPRGNCKNTPQICKICRNTSLFRVIAKIPRDQLKDRHLSRTDAIPDLMHAVSTIFSYSCHSARYTCLNGLESFENTLYILLNMSLFLRHESLALKLAESASILCDLGVFLQLREKVRYFCNFCKFEGYFLQFSLIAKIIYGVPPGKRSVPRSIVSMPASYSTDPPPQF